MYQDVETFKRQLPYLVRWCESLAGRAEAFKNQDAADAMWEVSFALRKLQGCLGKDGRMRRQPSSTVRI